ncbi:unnamed protein product [Darwinula stevensoni]|uniref:Uncharacterized protein n=1 Tax=Darwinula stevensoni TaxID=69355 RepID=A0A7R8X026_9CRUS|nr:unnamed protein product [Darwinula stevensoni]CAG0880759.1 unnamed protein product [Darwinula stevensoni]
MGPYNRTPIIRLAFFLSSFFSSYCVFGDEAGKCERITIPMCQDMPYNLTRMPNYIGHTNQAEAAIQVHEYKPLVEVGCSRHLRFFLCSLYAPMCTPQVDVPIPSCQSICREVQEGCLPVLRKFNFEWPQMLNCSRLPVPNKGLCMEFPESPQGMAPKPGQTQTSNTLLDFPGEMWKAWGATRSKSPLFPFPSHGTCPERHVYIGDVGRDVTCAPECGIAVHFAQRDKRFAEIWMTVWATLCFLSSFFTVATFWVDMSRFQYPERPIIFLSLCYNLYAGAFLVRAFAGAKSVSCDRTNSGHEYLIVEGVENTGCIVVFLILYYFGIASCIWWVILTLTWFLSAGKKWSNESVQALSTYFHVGAWLTPAVLAVIVLTMRQVDADELTGLCYVGYTDSDALLGFVIVPLCVFYALGVLFIASGFVALLRIRNVMKKGGRNIAKLEKLMVRILVFSVLYAVPALCVIVCHIYEWSYRDRWRTIGSNMCSGSDCTKPSMEILMLKIFMNLVVGVTSGMWVWSYKTCQSWISWAGKRCKDPKNKHAPSQSQLKPLAYGPVSTNV